MKLSSFSNAVLRFRFQTRLINSENTICHVNENMKLIKRHKLYCTPPVDEDIKDEIKSIVGIHVGLNRFSWARIELNNNCLTDLNQLKLPQDVHRAELDDIYSLAVQAVNALPWADRYVLEVLPKAMSGSTGKMHLSLQAARIQFVSMLTALLNSHRTDDITKHKVAFLKQRLSTRLFNLSIGTENMSSIPVVTDILSGKRVHSFQKLQFSFDTLRFYKSLPNDDKEMLGLALTLTMTFNELIIQKNIECFRSLIKISKNV